MKEVQYIQQGLTHFQRLFAPIQPNQVNVAISRATGRQLLKALKGAIKKIEDLNTIVGGRAGFSTQPPLMLGQTLYTLSNFSEMPNGLTLSHILEFGLISHALDGRHLLAGLAYLEKHPYLSNYLETIDSEKGKQVLQRLIDVVDKGEGDSQVEALMTARLREAAMIVYQAVAKDPSLAESIKEQFLQIYSETS